MGIFRSTNPTDWAAVDGIIINESAPPPFVSGVPANIAILCGQFERGATTLQQVTSVGDFYEKYGNNIAFSGNIALQNKQFGTLKIVRVVDSSAVKAHHTFQATAEDIITFTALWTGAYGNSIKVTVAAGTTAGSKYTVHDNNTNAVFPDEVYDNVVISAVGTTFANSNLVAVTVVASDNEPDAASATSLASGADGTVADTHYQTAITAQQIEAAGNILFLDSYNSTRNGYIKTSMAATTDRMAVICGAAGDSVSTAVSAVASKRDTDGRIIYAFPYVYTTINGVNTKVQPASFYASLLSQIAPNIDPAFAGNVQYLAGVNSLELPLQRGDYISLVAAGISAFEDDADLGIKVKSGVVTQISDTSKLMVSRRRMADYLTYSIAKFLKNYQNAPNSLENRTNSVGAIAAFNRQLELVGMVPKDAEVQGGTASIVDGNILNTNNSIAQGYFKILYKRRIYSSMRYIVLQAQIGESVVVTAS